MKRATPLLFTLGLLVALSLPQAPQSTLLSTDQSFVLPTRLSASASPTGEVIFEEYSGYTSDVIQADHEFDLLSLSWKDESPDQTLATIEVRTQGLNGEWNEWVPAHEDHDGLESDEKWSYFVTERSQAFQYRVVLSSADVSLTPQITELSFDYHSGGTEAPLKSFFDESTQRLGRLIFSDEVNDIISRSEWGADESIRLAENYQHIKTSVVPETDDDEWYPDMAIRKTIDEDNRGRDLWWPQEYPEDVKKIIIHHTATTKDLDRPEAAVRAIYQFHALSRGWGDIGYNYIIDSRGNIYEGRAGGSGVVAAHTGKFNTGSVGIALLGEYNTTAISGPMMQSLMGLIQEVAQEHDIEVDAKETFRGQRIENLLAHRDLTSTACPGDMAYDFLPQLREIIDDNLNERRHVSNSSQYAFEESSDRELILLEKDEDKTVKIKLKNTGSTTWNSAHFLVRSYDDADDIASIDKDREGRIAIMKQASVTKGRIAEFEFEVEGEGDTGLAQFAITPVFNGHKSNQVVDLAIYVEPEVRSSSASSSSSSSSSTSHTNVKTSSSSSSSSSSPSVSSSSTGEILASTSFGRFEPGESRNMWIQIQNNTRRSWDSDEIYIRAGGFNGIKVTNVRIPLKTIPAGQSAKIYFKLTVPTKEGRYKLTLMPRDDSKNLLDDSLEYSIQVGGEESAPVVIPKQSNDGDLRVRLTPDNALAAPILTSDDNFVLYEGDRFVANLSARSQLRLIPSGNSFKASSGRQSWTLSSPITVIPENGVESVMTISNMQQRPGWNPSLNDNSFRGTLEIRRLNNETVIINELPIEYYLRGLGEVSNGDPEDKIKSIIVIARTYANWYISEEEKFPGMPYHLDDSPERSQRYLGYGFEKRARDIVSAVEDTEGEVVTYLGEIVKTPYFSSTDGTRTRSAQSVWGWTNTPYLISVSDSHCKGTAFAGHGVGLSGCGATELAKKGQSYVDIIKYYFRGVEVEKQ